MRTELRGLSDGLEQPQRILKFYKELVDGGLPDVMAAELASREYQRVSFPSTYPIHVYVNGDPDTAAEEVAKQIYKAIGRSNSH